MCFWEFQDKILCTCSVSLFEVSAWLGCRLYVWNQDIDFIIETLGGWQSTAQEMIQALLGSTIGWASWPLIAAVCQVGSAGLAEPKAMQCGMNMLLCNLPWFLTLTWIYMNKPPSISSMYSTRFSYICYYLFISFMFTFKSFNAFRLWMALCFSAYDPCDWG